MLVLASLVTSCVVGEGSPETGSTPTPAPAPVDAAPLAVGGVVDQPVHGSVIAGDPSTISLHVVAHYSAPGEPCQVQVLADPGDLTSWITIGSGATDTTATSGGGYGLALDVQPVTGTADAARWPSGGVLRLRVIDSSDHAFLASGFEADAVTTIAVVNPQPAPTDWLYLQQKGSGSIAETQAYYAATAAPTTLSAFMSQYGFAADGANETAASYYNNGDLAVGRAMHCRATTTPAGGLACYVSNFGSFDGDPNVAIAALETAAATPIATVAMVYSPPITAPNAVSFVVYNPAGALQDSAQLDTHGDNTAIPQNCINCHGGASSYDATTHAATGARFLPFDPAAFEFGSAAGFTLLDQQDQIRALDQLVLDAAPTEAIEDVIGGIFPTACVQNA